MSSCSPWYTLVLSWVQLNSASGWDSAQHCRIRVELSSALMVLSARVSDPLVKYTRSGPSACRAKYFTLPSSTGKITYFFFQLWHFFPFIFISWRLITLQYCSGFCHILTWISHGFTCVPHPDLPSRFPPHPIPLGLPSAPAPSTCLMHPTWAGDLFHTW